MQNKGKVMLHMAYFKSKRYFEAEQGWWRRGWNSWKGVGYRDTHASKNFEILKKYLF